MCNVSSSAALAASGSAPGFSSYMSSIVDTSALLDTSIMDNSMDSTLHTSNTNNYTLNGGITETGEMAIALATENTHSGSNSNSNSNSSSNSSSSSSSSSDEGTTHFLDCSMMETAVVPLQASMQLQRQSQQQQQQQQQDA